MATAGHAMLSGHVKPCRHAFRPHCKTRPLVRNCAEPHDNVAPSRRELLSYTVAGIAASQVALPQNVTAGSALQDIEPLETIELGRTGTAKLKACSRIPPSCGRHQRGKLNLLSRRSQSVRGRNRSVVVGSVHSRTISVAQSLLQSPIISVYSISLSCRYWGYNKGYTRSDNEQAYKAVVENGISFVDTAESWILDANGQMKLSPQSSKHIMEVSRRVYGFGLSEEILGAAMREAGRQPFIATKFAPLPWRFSSDSVVKALRGSLDRLSVSQIGLYQIHWPGFLTQAGSNDAFVRGLANCAQLGLTKAVGVSNFRADRVKRAADILEGEGQQLASNQVQYSLLYRMPETNGVVDSLKESGATLIAYSPLCQGLLTGKYNESNLPSGPRAAVINKDRLKEVAPLLDVMREISKKRGKTLAQIAINWTLCKGALPIPGAKNAKQVKESAGAFGWRLSADEVAALDVESGKLKPSLANPVEGF